MLDPTATNVIAFPDQPSSLPAESSPEISCDLSGPVALLNRLRDAIRDPRLNRAQLLVLEAIVGCVNGSSGTAYPSRRLLADETGQSLKSIENRLYELRKLGYLKWDRREQDGRNLMHYIVVGIDRKVPVTAGTKSTRPNGDTRPVGRKSTRPVGVKSTRQDGVSNLKRGTSSDRSPIDIDGTFSEFWTAFPPGRKNGKPKTKDLFRRIVRDGKATPEELIRAAKRYAATRPNPDYTPMPITWLNGGRWEDDVCQPAQGTEVDDGALIAEQANLRAQRLAEHRGELRDG